MQQLRLALPQAAIDGGGEGLRRMAGGGEA